MQSAEEKIIKQRNQARLLEELDITKEIVLDGESYSFTPRELFDGALMVYVPELFVEMDSEIAKIKYPSEFRPNIILTNERNNINFAFTKQDSEISEAQLGDCILGFRAAMKKLFPTAVLSAPQKLLSQDKCEVHFFTYEVGALDQIIFGFQTVFSVNGLLTMGSFNCPKSMKHEWDVIVRQVIGSITVAGEGE